MGDPARRRKTPPFVMVYHKWMDTPAWAALTNDEVHLLLQLLRIYNGENNGRIALSERRAATLLGIARNTAARAFDGLEARGFIRPARKGCFDVKGKATEWRLTMWPASGKIATHDYQKWRPEEKA